MQKAISLQPQQQQRAAQMEQEGANLLAQYGRLMLDKERIEKALPQLEERQRAFVREMVEANQIREFNNARIERGNLIVDLPDSLEAPEIAPVPKTNGALHLEER